MDVFNAPICFVYRRPRWLGLLEILAHGLAAIAVLVSGLSPAVRAGLVLLAAMSLLRERRAGRALHFANLTFCYDAEGN